MITLFFKIKKMKKLILILGLIAPLFSVAQLQWFPMGAEWYYNLPNTEATTNYVALKVDKDTVIGSKACKKIIFSTNAPAYSWSEIFYQSSDSIFYFNSGMFHLLYNFSAEVGDTITVHSSTFKPTRGFFYDDSIKSFAYRITKIDSVNISGKWLKRQSIVRLTSSDWSFEGISNPSVIVETIGNLNYFFGQSNNSNPEMNSPLCRCYNGGGIEYKSAEWGKECDFIQSTEVKERKGDMNVIVSNDNILITSANTIKTITVISLDGKIHYSQYFHNHKVTIPATYLLHGFYIVSMIDVFNQEYTKIITF